MPEAYLGTEPYIYYKELLDGVESARSLILRDGIKTTLSTHKREKVLVASCPSEKDMKAVVKKGAFPIPIADMLDRCRDGKYQPIFTSAYLFIYCSDNPAGNAYGYLLTGRQTYDKQSGLIYYEIDPLRIGGAFEIAEIISKQTCGTNVGPFFLSFEEAADDSFSAGK